MKDSEIIPESKEAVKIIYEDTKPLECNGTQEGQHQRLQSSYNVGCTSQ